jgi:hypothetical protein
VQVLNGLGGGGTHPKNLSAPVSGPKIPSFPVPYGPPTGGLGDQDGHRGGGEGPERVAEHLLGDQARRRDHPKPVQAGGRERIGDLVGHQERAVRHGDRHPRRRVPRGTTSATSTSRRTGRRGAPRARTRTSSGTSRGRTPNAIPIEAGEEVRTRPRRRRVPGRQHVDGTVEGPGARLQTPIEGAPTSTGTPRESVYRSYGTTAVPYAGAARRPWTAMSTRYTPRTRFKNSLGRPSRSPACRHARPGRRRRTQRRCPLAITVMRIPMLCSSNLLPRKASPGVTRTRSRLAPPSRGALLRVAQLDRVAEDVFRGLDEVVERRLRTNSNPAGAAAARLHPLGPPDGRTRAPLAPWGTPGSPAGLPWRTRCSS